MILVLLAGCECVNTGVVINNYFVSIILLMIASPGLQIMITTPLGLLFYSLFIIELCGLLFVTRDRGP